MELKNLGQTAASALIHTDIRLEREHWTMFRNKLLGIAAAATLGSAAMLGSTAANAQGIDLDAMVKTSPAVTIAKETLSTKVADDSMYYVVTDDASTTGQLDITVATGVAGAGVTTDDLVVTYTLEGMVFNTALTSASMSGAGITGPSLSSGGMKNDSTAIFTGKKGGVGTTSIVLDVDDLGIMSDGSGSVSVTIVNLQQRAVLQNVPGVENPGTKIASYPGAVTVKSGVKPAPAPNNLMATVANSFQSFGMDTTASPPTPILTGTLGSFTVGLEAAAAPFQRNASDGSTVETLGVLVESSSATASTVGDNDSSVTIMGDFSFVSAAWLDSAAACTTAGDLRITDATDPTMVTDDTKLRAQPLGYVIANPNLCITVPAHTEEMPVSIPAASYSAMVSYKAGSAGGMMLPAAASYDLGKITRDGTTVRLPYLSTHDKFHQRIRIVNRSSAEARYEIVPHGADDMAGMDATGMLDANSITVLSLSDDDVVTPANGNNTSATLIIEAPQGMIDVATVLVTRATGASDTVVHSR